MRPASPAWPYALRRSHRIVTRAESWLDGTRLGAVPISDGELSFDDTATLRRRAKLTVPMFDPVSGARWDPSTDPAAPLACYGQRLHIRTGLELPSGGIELMDQGWYLLTRWELDEAAGSIDIDAVDLAQLITDARLYYADAPAEGASVLDEVRRMCDGILPVVVDDDVPDRKVQPATTYDREREKNLDKLTASIGARWLVDDDGALRVAMAYEPVDQTTPVTVALHSGSEGSVIVRSREGARERLYNAVVVTGKAPDGGELTPVGVAEITDADSPIRVDGPYGHKPKYFSSEQLGTDADCLAVAQSMLPDASSVSRSEPVDVLPDPSVELGDVAEVLTQGMPWRGRITAITLPLAPGQMKVTVSNVPRAQEDEG
ncbi:hypothetical protein KGQ20_13925 [Catenulispora sp. NF23]|uniref:hypothetical protein n=1 Tax=Catenulispora pinistramenti TaxID=2705254 RepID=UPI001BA6089B|nr:hypothetical protein [Catenulispora pinistramenti]MBS2533867.1 hypothetical protein [Catenulispora pinistramenti]